MSSSWGLFALAVFLLGITSGLCQIECPGDRKHTDGQLAGAVVGSILCTLIATCGVFFAFYWFYIRKRDGKLDFEDATKPGYRVHMAPTGATRNGNPNSVAGRAVRPPQTAYVNVGFTDPSEQIVLTQQQQRRNQPKSSHNHVDHAGETHDHLGRHGNLQPSVPARTTQPVLRHPKSHEDKFYLLHKNRDRVKVKLRGHDFTGLGFNICGNLRDGIYVQNVLQRGPAAESGLLEPGDRILDVQVSFKNIVFEDALTILSYASPYDVTLSVKKHDSSGSLDSSSSSAKSSRRSSSLQMRSAGPSYYRDRNFFPLKRSQSIGDLDMIAKADFSSSEDSRPATDPYIVDKRSRSRTEPALNERTYHGQQSSPASSIRHVITKPNLSTWRHSRESSVSTILSRQETPKGTAEETVDFNRIGSPKKKAAPPPPPPQQSPLHERPRAFSSVSESSEDTSTHRSLGHPDENRSFGESSMVNEIFKELEQDRSATETMETRRQHGALLPRREYQTFEMVWTEGSESETSSVVDKLPRHLPRQQALRVDSGYPNDHTYVRQAYPSYSSDSRDEYVRSPHVIQTSAGSRLILPVNMEPTPSISTPTSFNSDEDSSPDRRHNAFKNHYHESDPSSHRERQNENSKKRSNSAHNQIDKF